tara:strand:- start:483 stop:749 length:267 start_codon:yes stop_codon:yes gene_type:complete
VDLDTQQRNAVASVTQQCQLQLQNSQFKLKTLDLAGINQRIGKCLEHLATETDAKAQKRHSRALRHLVLQRTKLHSELAKFFASHHLQ